MSIHHHHHHHHEHGPDCDCTCHEHGHEHGPDCDCGCHRHDAAAVVENALILSRSGSVRFSPPQSAESVFSELVRKIREISERIAVDGVILGHVKALMQCPAGRMALSITRVDAPDVTALEGWQGDAVISECRLSLNILSLGETAAQGEVEALVNRLFD